MLQTKRAIKGIFMQANKKEVAVTPEVEKPTEKKEIHFYPDVAFNKRERRRALILSSLLLLFLGGFGVAIIVGGFQNPDDPMGWISGVLMLVLFVLTISTIPSAFKQYPVKEEPIITLKQKEITIMGETFKQSDILEVRLTITLASVGNKQENEKFLDSVLGEEPPRNVTANLDFAVPDKKDKTKTIYTTVANGYEALLALYQAGYKHYSIVYSLKKLAKASTYNLGKTKTEDGKELATLSKKERLKQLF